MPGALPARSRASPSPAHQCARAGIASGNVEPYEFSDIDRTVAAGGASFAFRMEIDVPAKIDPLPEKGRKAAEAVNAIAQTSTADPATATVALGIHMLNNSRG